MNSIEITLISGPINVTETSLNTELLDVTLCSGQIPVDTSSCGSTSIEIGIASIGPAGPPGNPERLFYIRIAAENLGGHRAVMSNIDKTVSYADANIVSHLGKVLGITDFAVLEGEEVDIIRQGPMEFVGWDWDIEKPIYLASNGLLTQTPTATGFSQIVGFAESPTVLFVNLREPILLT